MPICWFERVDRDAMARQFCLMAIGPIFGFSSQKALDRGSKIPQARSSALWAPFHDDVPNRIDAALWIVIARHRLTRSPFERSGLAFCYGHGRFACGMFKPVDHAKGQPLARARGQSAFSQVPSFQEAAIQIPSVDVRRGIPSNASIESAGERRCCAVSPRGASDRVLAYLGSLSLGASSGAFHK